jgi:hypothetical protein
MNIPKVHVYYCRYILLSAHGESCHWVRI